VNATIDPIVYPGSTSTPHFHDFYGNPSVDENSTGASLAAVNSTSCTTSTDTASYWAPTLILGPGETQDHGPDGFPCATNAAGLTACHYSNIRAYYSLSGASRAALANVPAGMAVVGGDGNSLAPQPTSRVGWACGGSSPFEQYPYDCTNWINTTGNADQDGVVMRIIMPRCWNGLDATVRANFAYPLTGTGPACPAGFSHVLPLVNVRFHTGITTPCPGQSCPAGSHVTPDFGFELADGTMMSWFQAHGDFLNGWQSGEGGVTDLITDCLKLAQRCPVNPRTSPVSNMPT
jgi:hypothetical protein